MLRVSRHRRLSDVLQSTLRATVCTTAQASAGRLVWPPPDGAHSLPPELLRDTSPLQQTVPDLSSRWTGSPDAQEDALAPARHSILALSQSKRKQLLVAPSRSALTQLQVAQLRQELQKWEQPSAGLKAELVERLMQLYAQPPARSPARRRPKRDAAASAQVLDRHHKIFESPDQVVELLQATKCDDVKLLRVAGVCDWTENFVVATGRSGRHAATAAAALSHAARERCQAASIQAPSAREGGEDSDWQVVDLGNVVAHVFVEEARLHYALEAKWQSLISNQAPEDIWNPA